MPRLLGSSLLAFSLAAIPAFQDVSTKQAGDGPGHVMRDDLLENLVGDWKLTRKIRGKVVGNTLSAEWVLQHQFLQLHMQDVAEPPTYEALVLIGYSYADKKYVAHWCDTYGGKFSSTGSGARSGDSIEFTFPYPDGPFFNTFTWDAKTKGWTFKLENGGKDGTRAPFATDTLERN